MLAGQRTAGPKYAIIEVFGIVQESGNGVKGLGYRGLRCHSETLQASTIYTGYLKVQGEKDMGYQLNEETFQKVFDAWSRDYDLYAPKLYAGTGRFSETDVVRYGVIKSPEDIV